MHLDALEKQIEQDLDWRHAELAIFREILTLDSITTVRKAALFRASWSLLYAHYEGFCKHSLQLLVEFMASFADCKALTDSTFIFLHDKILRKGKSGNNAEAYEFFRTTLETYRSEPPPKVAIDTKSNLWPSLLRELLQCLDIPVSGILDQETMIKTLVARRNDIAHGQKVFIKDLPVYLEYENATRNLMYGLALAIVDRAAAY